jgi:hypothetical protein
MFLSCENERLNLETHRKRMGHPSKITTGQYLNSYLRNVVPQTSPISPGLKLERPTFREAY